MTLDPVALYRQAREREAAGDSGDAGFYNRNIRVTTDDGSSVIVRTRKPQSEAEVMDPQLWLEEEVLAAIAPYVASAPRLLHASEAPRYQIHSHVEGSLLADLAPDGTTLPEGTLAGIEFFFAQLLRVPRTVLPPVVPTWPADGDTSGFAVSLLDLVREIRHCGDERIRGLYDAIGVPEDPCAFLQARTGALAPRPFRLLHADIHRKNMIITASSKVVFLDWELALWADPVYDLADHIHKTSYTLPDRAALLGAWERAAPAECRERWREDLPFHLAYQEMKSAVVDTVRWGRRIAEAPQASRLSLARELENKLIAARSHWGDEAHAGPDARKIMAAAEYWMAET